VDIRGVSDALKAKEAERMNRQVSEVKHLHFSGAFNAVMNGSEALNETTPIHLAPREVFQCVCALAHWIE